MKDMKVKRHKKRSAEDWLVDGLSYGLVLILMVQLLLPLLL